MSTKVTLQNIIESFCRRFQMSKKSADAFSKALFETITEGLNEDGTVQINGFGVFRIVEVAERGSVNVATGERILISGYKKVAFTPEIDKIPELYEVTSDIPEEKDNVEGKEDSATTPAPVRETKRKTKKQILAEQAQAEQMQAENTATEIAEEIEAQCISVTESPSDSFSGIDLVIATPESMEELQREYIEARKAFDKAFSDAITARSNMKRLEKMLSLISENGVLDTIANENNITNEKQASYAAESVSQSQVIIEPTAIENTTETDANERNVAPEGTEPCTTVGIMDERATADEDNKENTLNPEIETDTENDSEEDTPPEVPGAEEIPIILDRSSVVERYLSEGTKSGYYEKDEEDDDGYEDEKKTWAKWAVVPVLGILLSLCAILIYRMEKEEQFTQDEFINNVNNNIQPNTTVPQTAPEKPATPTPKDEIEKKDTTTVQAVATEDAAPQTPKRPKKYVIKKGDTLSKIARRFYGSGDSLSIILRGNKFADPNNVPIGEEINLP